MAKPEKAKAGCFSSFLKVLPCAGNGSSPPVHPSDHVTESDETELVRLNPNKDAMVDDYAASTPGVVARLMGLESLPNTSLLTKGATPDSVPRSRSVNFVDYLLQFDLNHANNHRRVKTSASFREVPALVQRKNSDLVVLYWDDYQSKDEEARCNLKKKEMGLGESKQKMKKQGNKNKEVLRERVVSVKKELNQGKNKKISKLKNEPRRVPSSKKSRMVRNHHCEAKDFSTVSSSSDSCSYRCSGAGSTSNSSSNSPLPSKKKKGFVEPKFTDNKRNQKSPKKIETEYDSENLSPVSVIDTIGYPFLLGTDFKDSRHSISPLVAKSKWKSSSLLSLGDGVEERASNNEDSAYTDLNRDAGYYSELILKLRTLTENDIRESEITSKGIYENEGFEEICYMFENRILDLLLHEFVNEVVQLSC